MSWPWGNFMTITPTLSPYLYLKKSQFNTTVCPSENERFLLGSHTQRRNYGPHEEGHTAALADDTLNDPMRDECGDLDLDLT